MIKDYRPLIDPSQIDSAVKALSNIDCKYQILLTKLHCGQEIDDGDTSDFQHVEATLCEIQQFVSNALNDCASWDEPLFLEFQKIISLTEKAAKTNSSLIDAIKNKTRSLEMQILQLEKNSKNIDKYAKNF